MVVPAKNFQYSKTKMNKLIFATNNPNKVLEIKSLLTNKIPEIISLKDAGIIIDIPEPYNTLEENAIEKATVIYNLTKTPCFAEDTGLEVNALNGEPGVHSARYAGEHKNFEDNIDKLLSKQKNSTDRSAQFRTVICLKHEENIKLFEGICKGTITTERRGTNGFGYDSIFMPDGSDKTFAEMDLGEKNIFSHRKKATKKLIAYLESFKPVNDTMTKQKN